MCIRDSLYPLEVRGSQEEEATEEETVDPETRDEPERESVTERPRRAAAARARDRILAQAISESQD